MRRRQRVAIVERWTTVLAVSGQSNVGSEEMGSTLTLRRMALLTGAVVTSAALIAGGLTGSAAATKKHAKNPLAGRWTGMTAAGRSWPGPPAPISFQITKRGYVLNFTTTVTLNYGPSECSSAPPFTVNMPPVRMNKPVPGYPKGKRFDYSGPYPLVRATGQVITARKMQGYLAVRQVEISPTLKCGTGLVHYNVTRAGR